MSVTEAERVKQRVWSVMPDASERPVYRQTFMQMGSQISLWLLAGGHGAPKAFLLLGDTTKSATRTQPHPRKPNRIWLKASHTSFPRTHHGDL